MRLPTVQLITPRDTEIAPGSDVVGKDLQLDRFGHQLPPQAPLYDLPLPKLANFFCRVAGEAAQHIISVLAL